MAPMSQIRLHSIYISAILLLIGPSCQSSSIAGNIAGVNLGTVQHQQPQQQPLQQASQTNEVLSMAASDPLPVLASSAGTDNQYRATYYYPVRTTKASTLSRYANLNRDSYSDAAQDYGYNLDAPTAYQTPYQGHTHSASYNTPSIFSSDDSIYDLESQGTSLGGLGGFGGLSGLGGILGLKGLKGLGILGFLKGSYLLPMLVFLFPLLLLAPLILLLLPIPVITIPSNPSGRMGGSMGLAEMTSTIARAVLESDNCVERFSCEISRFNRGTFLDKALTKIFNQLESQLPTSLRRVARAYLEKPSCKKYTCNLMESFSKKKSL